MGDQVGSHGVPDYMMRRYTDPVRTARQTETCLSTVGPRITAATLGLTDARPLVGYRRGVVPRDELVRIRLDILHGVVTGICREYNGAVAAAFLRSSNPELDDEAPLMVIRQADSVVALKHARARVVDAVRAMME